ncbi:MAG TPA: MarR family transcriptional regulator [Opitutaceae bacterium]|nr:MarR family transcriptional regulator [Opitutaceae bacterium]
MIDHDSPSARALLGIAEGRAGINAACCRVVFRRLGAAARLRRSLQRMLSSHALTELQFAILVVLHRNEPEPTPMAALAEDTGVSRSAVTDALDDLEARRLAHRARDRGDRRVLQVRVTPLGAAMADQAINDYLGTVARAAAPTVRNLPARSAPGSQGGPGGPPAMVAP